MRYGTTKTGKIHVFTNTNECLCDLNIQIDKAVSKEYADTKNICFHCLRKLLIFHIEVKA